MYWRHGWPTIWTPITASISATDHPDLIGQQIGIFIENIGDPESVIAIDDVSYTYKAAQ